MKDLTGNNVTVHSKLSLETQVRMMVRYYMDGETSSNLARLYGVSRTYVSSRIGTGKNSFTKEPQTVIQEYERRYGKRPVNLNKRQQKSRKEALRYGGGDIPSR